MDKIIYIPSFALSMALIAVYIYKCKAHKAPFNHSILINCVLQSSGIVCGALLIVSTVSDTVKNLITGIDLYILISGLAVIAVSFQGLYKDIFSITKENGQ